MLYVPHVRRVIGESLRWINLWSPEAEELVLGTGLVESRYQYLYQLGGGPAVGLWQMEPATHDDLWLNYLTYRRDLRSQIEQLAGVVIIGPELLAINLKYAAAMCRVHYRRVKAPLPAARDPEAQAQYWKIWYNTRGGKGRAEEYVKLYEEHIREWL